MSESRGVLFVCLGNICRSPMAEAAFKYVIAEAGREKEFHVDSAGTSRYHIGEPPDPRMQMTADRHGVHMEHRGRQFCRSDFDIFDTIFAMDRDNLDDMLLLTQNSKLRAKVHLLRDFDPCAVEGASVPDPYYGDGAGFEEVFDICMRSAREFLKSLPAK